MRTSIEQVQMGATLALSPDDIKRLLEDGGTQTRVDITDKIAGAYSATVLQDREYKIADQIFRLLLRDTEVRVRASLAQNIKESNIIPRDIILNLARDVEEVSLPVLTFSEILTESDLLELVNASEEVSRYLAISKRRSVSPSLSHALLKKQNEEVTTSLIQNKGAEITEEDITDIIDHHRANQGLMEALGARPKLPLSAVEKLVTFVSGNLADTLKKKYQFPVDAIEEESVNTRETETLQLVKNIDDDVELDKLVAQMHASDRLSPSVILSSLCQGNFSFFEASLAKLSGIPIANARILLNDKGDLGFRGLYNKSGLPETLRPAVRLLFKVVHELSDAGEKPGKGSRYINRVVEKILHYSEQDPIENLSYIIALVRRSSAA